MPEFKTISELSRELGCRPRDLSDLFYSRVLSDVKCPVVSGRRLIPADYTPEIKKVLAEHGKLPETIHA